MKSFNSTKITLMTTPTPTVKKDGARPAPWSVQREEFSRRTRRLNATYKKALLARI